MDNQGRTFVGPDQTFRTATAPDTTAPRVTCVVPAENATGVAPAANVTAYFSEAMRASTVTGSTVKLFKAGSTTAVPATVTYDATAKRATLNPSANLQLGVKYRAVVSPAARDAAGNALDQDPNLAGSQPKSWFFTIRK